jgi:tetratricopeptide (TPR) repeat protein
VEPCSGAHRAVEEIWNEDAKSEVRGALERSGAPDGVAIGLRVAEILDRYARAWTGTRREACEETRPHGAEAANVLSARMVCLDRGLHQMGTLVRLLRSADQAMALKAMDAAIDLPSVGMCDAAALSAPPALPDRPGARAEVEAVQSSLDEVRQLHGMGRFDQALKLAEPAAARAEVLGYWPLRAEALYWLGLVQDRTGAPKLADQTLRQAVVAADRARSEPDRIRALTRLVMVEGWSLARFDEAAFFAQLAESELQRFPSDELQLDLELNRGLWLTNQRRMEDAVAAYQRALGLADRSLGPDHPKKGLVLCNLAGVEEELGRHQEAISLLKDALRIVTATRGPHHPVAAYVHYNLARALLAQGDYPAAHQSAQEAIRIREAALGPNHPGVAEALDVLATILQSDGLYAEALAQSERALEIKRRALGPDNLDLSWSLENVGFAHLSLRAPAHAVAPLEQALALRERAGQPAADLAAARFALARALWETGKDRRRARALAATAREGAREGNNSAVVGQIDGWLASRS